MQRLFQRKHPLFKLADSTGERGLPRPAAAGRMIHVSRTFTTQRHIDVLIQ